MTSIFRVFLITLLIFICPNLAHVQPVDFASQLKLPTVLPASPDAAAIEKFGNIPVTYSTGVPDISIPIWNIQCGRLSWPVSISYHAGGIRVDEVASCVGLGWALNAPGAITRSVAGLPDEGNSFEPLYEQVTSGSNQAYLYQVLNGTADSEYDIFNFSFNGRSGKFIIKQDGSILQIPLSNLKITYAGTINSFTITDENGITYLFDQTELATSIPMLPMASSTLTTSAWYLSKVELPDKRNAINFTYGFGGSMSREVKNFHHAIGDKYEPPPLPLIPPILQQLNSPSVSGVSMTTDFVKLSTITFPNGSISFTYDAATRSDIGPATNRLTGIAINLVSGSVSTQLKRFILYQSYFFNNPNNSFLGDSRLYRLRLDSLAETGMSVEVSPKKYKFQYNSTPMVPRENYGQDIWGFNNGQSGNTTLLKTQTVVFNNFHSTRTYNFGTANRNVHANKMKACMLSSITYPTGGKSEFIFEPHVYDAEGGTSVPAEAKAEVFGNQPSPQIATATFIFPTNATAEYPRVFVEMSNCDFPGVTERSWVSLYDLTTSSHIYSHTHAFPSQKVEIDQEIFLQPGHNYELKAYVYTNTSNAQLSASISVKWNIATGLPDIQSGGGLRIKEIKHFTNNGVLATTESFVYDLAVTLTPFYHIKQEYSQVYYRLGIPNGLLGCTYHFSPVCRTYTSSSVYPISTAVGSPMLYPKVQKFITDAATGLTTGKTEYRYDVFRDVNFPVGGTFMMIPLISNDWKNGSLRFETQYKVTNGVYSVLSQTENRYLDYNSSVANTLRVQGRYIFEGCKVILSNTFDGDAIFYLFPIRTGSRRLSEQIVTLADENQNSITTSTINEYGNSKYDYPTKTKTINSKNSEESTTFLRSPDLAATGNIYEKMETRNILAPILEQRSYNGTTILNSVKTTFRDWFNDGKVISPEIVQAAVLTNPLEDRLRYYNYDPDNNPLETGKSNDVSTSYIWGYSKAYPIAEVANANNSTIAYTSFETSETGGWSGLIIPGYVSNGSVTGKKALTQTGFNISKTGLSSTSTYIVSYWSKNGAYSVNSTTSTNIKTINGWTLYEHKVINPAGGTISVSGSGSIDELRLYPSNAQMKTFTYEGLKGISSTCDINNRIQYYFYDGLARLILIKDEFGKILKQFCYNYAGQPESCKLYGNAIESAAYLKSDCSSGSGSLVTYIVPANTYYSSTLADANNLAVADRNAYGPLYANSYGTCTPTQITLNIQNSAGIPYTVTFSNSSGSHQVIVNANSSTSISIPAATYNVYINPNVMPGSVTFIVNGYSYYGTNASFSGIYMGPGSIVQIID